MRQLLFLLSVSLLFPLFSTGTTYTVNSLANTNTGAGTTGTLRYCVTQANLTVGPHTINFSVAGSIPINADAVAIPNLARAITIDATTAPGYAGSPVVTLNGTGSVSLNGLNIAAPNCAVYGLEIMNFPYRGVYFSPATVTGCTFGSAGKGNVVRANGYYGIQLQGADNNVIAYNKVGVTANGATCSANLYDGIDLIGGADNNQILNNHISCNGYNGLQIGNSHNNIVKGNTIGPLTGTCSNNGYRGIDLEGGSHDNVIGSTVPGEGNKVAGDLYWGIEVKEAGTIRNIISGNSISCNDYGGIEINTGGNIGIAIPVITSATTGLVSGTSLANSIIEIFTAQDPAYIICPMAPTPNNQGIDYLGTTTATAGGAWSIAGTFNGSIVATQRDAAGNTSRFSAAVTTGAAPVFVSNCPGVVVLAAGYMKRFSVFCTGGNRAKLEWELESKHDLVNLRVERSHDAATFSAIADFGPEKETSFLLFDPINISEAAYYRIAMTSQDGEVSYSEVQGISAGSCIQDENSFVVFPNPASEALIVSLKGSGDALVSITDMQGKAIFSPEFRHVCGTETIRWELSGVAPGLYTVYCIMNGARSVRKIAVE